MVKVSELEVEVYQGPVRDIFRRAYNGSLIKSYPINCEIWVCVILAMIHLANRSFIIITIIIILAMILAYHSNVVEPLRQTYNTRKTYHWHEKINTHYFYVIVYNNYNSSVYHYQITITGKSISWKICQYKHRYFQSI